MAAYETCSKESWKLYWLRDNCFTIQSSHLDNLQGSNNASNGKLLRFFFGQHLARHGGNVTFSIQSSSRHGVDTTNNKCIVEQCTELETTLLAVVHSAKTRRRHRRLFGKRCTKEAMRVGEKKKRGKMRERQKGRTIWCPSFRFLSNTESVARRFPLSRWRKIVTRSIDFCFSIENQEIMFALTKWKKKWK